MNTSPETNSGTRRIQLPEKPSFHKRNKWNLLIKEATNGYIIEYSDAEYVCKDVEEVKDTVGEIISGKAPAGTLLS